MTSAGHVKDALARFDQVKGVTNAERDEAWKRIKAAAGKFGVDVREESWQDVFAKNARTVPRNNRSHSAKT